MSVGLLPVAISSLQLESAEYGPIWNMAITACLIVHNEASVIERCLRSISSFVDEICIVDSGSDDGTVEIARRFGAHVKIDRLLADRAGRLRDFSAARNAVLKMATGRWVLSIDADEVFHVAQPPELRELLGKVGLSAIEMRIQSGGVSWFLPRLFLRKPWTRWHERVHEWVEIRGKTIPTDCAMIENLPCKIGKESAAHRDLRLCNWQLRENPDNLRAVFYLARALRHLGRYRDALPYYSRYWRESDFTAGRYSVAISAAICRLIVHDFEGSRRWAMRAYRLDSQLAEACCILGDANVGLGRLDLAVGWFKRAKSKTLPTGKNHLYVDRSSYHEYPLARLQWISELLLRSAVN